MRNSIYKNKHDPRILYRGTNPSRLDNLTDAVFGIAITLLIFNLSNPNSFNDLLSFTKTLPAFVISISFIVLIWNEHLGFSEVYSLNDTILTFLNTIFIALVIFMYTRCVSSPCSLPTSFFRPKYRSSLRLGRCQIL